MEMMRTFGSLFPELAARETRALVVRQEPGLPAGDYGFCDLYCVDPACDCRQVLLIVHRPGSVVDWAAIAYGWETAAFYSKWARCGLREAGRICRPSLDPTNEQSPYAPILLRLFSEVVLDAEYKRRLERHYRLFKEAIRLLAEVEARAAASRT